MKSKLKYIAIAIVVLAAIGGYYGYSEFNRQHKDTAALTVQEKIDANALVAAFESDETAANTKYLNKVIQVSGKIASTAKDKDGILTIYLASESMMATVSCQMEKGKEISPETLKEGNAVVITGLCSGYLTDVVLMRCVLNN